MRTQDRLQRSRAENTHTMFGDNNLTRESATEYLSAYIKVLRQKTRTTLPSENLSEQLLRWLATSISDGSVVSLPQSLYLPLILGPSREFVRIWLRTRQPTEIQEAREPLAKATWLVLAPPASQYEERVRN